MKRSLKNVICIVLILIMATMTYLTINYAKGHVNNNNEIGNFETPPEKPSGDNEQGNPPEKPSGDNEQGNPPEKPSGDNEQGNPPEKSSGDNEQGNPPEKPSGDNEQGNPPEKPTNNKSNQTQNANINYVYYIVFGIEGLIITSLITYLIMSNFNKKTLKETFTNKDKILLSILITIILTLTYTYTLGLITNSIINNNEQSDTKPSDDFKPGNNSSISYSSNNEITEDKTIESGSYESKTEDENAILVNGDVDVNISNVTISKTGDSNGGDSTSFYGTNSAILAKSKANLVLKNITIETNATGTNGVFSYGGSATTNNSSSDGTTVTISDSKITTTKDNSGGIMTTGGGIMNAYNLDITTSGISSAAIRTDRGGGVVTVVGGTYKTNGQGSPTIYSTANISVSDATLIATASEGVVIEGKNSVTLSNVKLEDTNNKLNGKSTTYKNIFLYQSMSGDAASGEAVFTSTDSTIITNNGDSFYVTNTTATINLSNNTIVNNDSNGSFLRVQKDSWGNSGSNGGDVTLNANNQNIIGNIVIDSISTLKFNLSNNSYYEGIINSSNEASSVSLSLDKSSSIKLMGDSYVTSFTNEDTTNSNIDFNGYKLYVNGNGIN